MEYGGEYRVIRSEAENRKHYDTALYSKESNVKT